MVIFCNRLYIAIWRILNIYFIYKLFSDIKIQIGSNLPFKYNYDIIQCFLGKLKKNPSDEAKSLCDRQVNIGLRTEQNKFIYSKQHEKDLLLLLLLITLKC